MKYRGWCYCCKGEIFWRDRRYEKYKSMRDNWTCQNCHPVVIPAEFVIWSNEKPEEPPVLRLVSTEDDV